MRVATMMLAVAALTAAAWGGSWPGGRQAAVVLTYDDALTSQLDNAVPVLDAAGLKGTFFLDGSSINVDDIGRWRAAAANGHELGNHTIFHPCARGTYAMPDRYTAESYTVDTMLSEIEMMNTVLTAIDGRDRHAFAMPCGQHLAGGVDYLPALSHSGLVNYARGVGERRAPYDPMDMPSMWFDEHSTGADMIAAVKRTEAAGGLLIIGFHGVGGDYLSVSAEAHAALVAYLKAHTDTIWVAPFSTVMDFVTHPPPH